MNEQMARGGAGTSTVSLVGADTTALSNEAAGKGAAVASASLLAELAELKEQCAAAVAQRDAQ